MMTFDGDTDPPKARPRSVPVSVSKDVTLQPLDSAGVKQICDLLNQARVSATVRPMTKEVALAEPASGADYCVLHVVASYVRNEKDEGRFVISREDAADLVRAGAHGAR